ncbi:MAG: hypothetical protein PHF86_05390 [Candidatus Nanoarchaeia archaeon]|nr:hypothetical protein [Candidatus Nanoarchaeia archaeon]
MKKRLIFVLLSLLFIRLVNASIDVNYNTNPVSEVIYEGYNCNGDCNNLNNLQLFQTKIGSGTSILVQYSAEGSYNNYFYKDCFYPYQTTGLISSIFNGQIIPVSLSKKSVCQTNIPSISVTGDQRVDSVLTISTTVNSPFQKGTSAPYNFVPSTRQDYYKAQIKIDLLIDGIEKQTVTKDIAIDGSENVVFIWTPSSSESGNHKIKIRTNVIDCKCSQPQSPQTSAESSVNILLQQQSCPTCQSSTSWSTCTNNQQTRTNYICNSTTDYQCQSFTETQSCSTTSCTLNTKQCSTQSNTILQTCTSSSSGNYWANSTCPSNKI